jgi:hypothetical protein
MVKHLDELDSLQKEILKTLKSGRSSGLTTGEIKSAIERDGYEVPGLKEVKEGIGELIEYGSVRGNVLRGGEKKYYLARGLGSGVRNQARLLGKTNVFLDTYKFLQRIFGVAFLVFGIGFITYGGLSSTGNIISASTPSSLDIGFILSFMLMLIGGILLFRNSKK